ncbi:malonate decarboxylase delta subunit [Rhodopseudomonas rhenobacensis]|uniref:Malonate decarboxylase acyl carrier protein n=1 Tax=Rhodopseudomonas rhenobacensis TaxID=87461 RepID=A0A7W7Z1C7_9BRAD|nr:malonate decarboxylase subunit delta [Rhodopseudomonas rhenobacensis]MBB5046210.1 malonate decarboxylase delta subunit [Rhodopseudomonas rhenobacensis]
MEILNFEFPSSKVKARRAHVGVVGSGDLEILMEPSVDGETRVTIQTSVAGFVDTWKAVVERFLQQHPEAANIEIHDFGATPGTVALRLQQAVEVSKS